MTRVHWSTGGEFTLGNPVACDWYCSRILTAALIQSRRDSDGFMESVLLK